MLETLDHTIRIGSTPTFLYFDLYLYSAYAAHYVCTYIYLFRNKAMEMENDADCTYEVSSMVRIE